MSALFCEACIRGMDSGAFAVATVLLGGISLVCFGLLWQFFKHSRLIEDTPTSRVRSAAQGFVELEGWVRGIDDMEIPAPLSGMPCLWYRFSVEEYQKDGGSGSWKRVDDGVSDQTFLLDDNTGTCIIDPDGATVTPSHKDVWNGVVRRPQDQPPGFVAAALNMSRRYRYTEERLVKNDFIYVLGQFETIGGGRISFDFAGTVRDIISEWKRDYATMRQRFDINNDGEIDLEEWKQVQAAAEQEAEKLRHKESTSPSLNMVVKPGDKTRPFLLSSELQDDLSKRYRWYSAACLAGFLLTGGYAFFMLVARLG